MWGQVEFQVNLRTRQIIRKGESGPVMKDDRKGPTSLFTCTFACWKHCTTNFTLLKLECPKPTDSYVFGYADLGSGHRKSLSSHISEICSGPYLAISIYFNIEARILDLDFTHIFFTILMFLVIFFVDNRSLLNTQKPRNSLLLMLPAVLAQII